MKAASGSDASPLVEIEQRVLSRMAGASGPVDRVTATELARDEVAAWNDDHRRGHRPFPLADPEVMVDRAVRNLVGYGPLAPLLADDDVWEVMINAPDAIFVKRHHGPSGFHHEVFHDDEHVLRTLTKVLDDASSSHRTLDPAEGLQDAQLDDGARVHIVHADLARGGHVMVNIRKFTGIPTRTLDELVGLGTIDTTVARFLAACVRARRSIVFAGAPGSGKTTLLSCCAAELDPSLRVVVAEEVFEADLSVANVAQMQTRPARVDRPAVDLRRLVAGFLRMAPDIAIVGEVRDREALPLLLTLSSGVKGFTTIHAGSARQALTRLRFICQLADTRSELPTSALNQLVTEAVDVVVHSQRTRDRIEVTSVIAVEELAGGSEATHFTVTEIFRRDGPGSPLRWSGQVPVRLAQALGESGADLMALLDPAATGFGGATAPGGTAPC